MNPTHDCPDARDDGHRPTAAEAHAGGYSRRRQGRTEPAQIIAVWVYENPPVARIFTGDQFADWAEMNRLTDTLSDPTHFYGVTTIGLVELQHTCHADPYDDDDYALVNHVWTLPDQASAYARGLARNDGRA